MTYSSKVALLGGIIDYAGTFPPAKLPVADALRRAATFRAQARHPWLMGKLAFNLADIKAMDARVFFERGADGDAWIFTALGSPLDPKGGLAGLARIVEWDLREIRAWNERQFDGPVRAFVAAYETRVPPEALASPAEAYEVLAPLLDRFNRPARCPIDPYVEVPLEGDHRRAIEAAIDALSRWGDRDDDGTTVRPGIKVRTGGAYVPTAAQLADVVVGCATAGLRFKATQGLHHAVSRAGEWGFVNLLAAIGFAYALGSESFGAKEAARCLEEADPRAFLFGEKDLSWGGYSLGVEAIEAARRLHGATFGSCSVDEPDEALAEEMK